MFNWFNRKKSAKSNQKCIIFPIINKEDLIDGVEYHTFKLGFNDQFLTTEATAFWNEKGQFFINKNCETIDYDIFQPIKSKYEQWKLDTYEYNPSKLNSMDIKELQNILYTMVDDIVESDDIYEKLLDWMSRRKLEL